MKIEKRETKEKGIVQITTTDERWYEKNGKFVPSVTWICGHYPKGLQFYKWLASKGWDEAEAIKNSAGARGSKVHSAIEDLIKGKVVKIDDKYLNTQTELLEELTVEEYEAILSFAEWFDLTKPKVIKNEFVVFRDKYNYAGTVDLLCEIENEIWLIDFKTSQNIWPEYELQLSAYKNAVEKVDKMGILQVGYRRNKRLWKMNEIDDKFNLFLAAKEIWENEKGNVQPKQKDYPLSIKLNKNY